jgi:hypothetical protein
MMNDTDMMSDDSVDALVDNRANLWETFGLSTGPVLRPVLAAPGCGRRVDSQTSSELRKWVLTHNPQALQHLLPFISLSLLNRTGSSL